MSKDKGMKTTEDLIILLSESIINDTHLQEASLPEIWGKIKGLGRGLFGAGTMPDQGTWRSAAKTAYDLVGPGSFRQIKYESNPVNFANLFAKLYINAKFSQFKALKPVSEKILQLLATYNAARDKIKEHALHTAQELAASRKISHTEIGKKAQEIMNTEITKNPAYQKLKEYVLAVRKSIPTDTTESINRITKDKEIQDIAKVITEDIRTNNGIILGD